MNTQLMSALIGALVGGAITVLGWLANYYFAQKRDAENQRREAAMELNVVFAAFAVRQAKLGGSCRVKVPVE